jgi:type IV pilus assembly protein PilV
MMGAGLNQQGPIAMAKKQHGSTLIEVLIALLVLSFGMMGMAGVQSVSLRGNQAAYFRTQATSLSMDIVERMRANLTAVGAGDYNNVSGGETTSCFTAAGCTSAQMAAQDINDWLAQVTALLPGGTTVVCLDSGGDDGTAAAFACDNTGAIYAIKIWWDDNRDGTANERYVTTFQPL